MPKNCQKVSKKVSKNSETGRRRRRWRRRRRRCVAPRPGTTLSHLAAPGNKRAKKSQKEPNISSKYLPKRLDFPKAPKNAPNINIFFLPI
jgi:hypothetical protein